MLQQFKATVAVAKVDCSNSAEKGKDYSDCSSSVRINITYFLTSLLPFLYCPTITLDKA